ncbi:MAG: hypothetical protein A3J75_01180 [Acidobacteria bacterium RBG_16_68_9]|nr:MAG: hypothetical protein A3J75_01180 [Acidobacteria bacterium RBG_16_68_9]
MPAARLARQALVARAGDLLQLGHGSHDKLDPVQGLARQLHSVVPQVRQQREPVEDLDQRARVGLQASAELAPVMLLRVGDDVGVAQDHAERVFQVVYQLRHQLRFPVVGGGNASV